MHINITSARGGQMGLRISSGTMVAGTDAGDDSIVRHQYAQQSERRESSQRRSGQIMARRSQGVPKESSQMRPR